MKNDARWMAAFQAPSGRLFAPNRTRRACDSGTSRGTVALISFVAAVFKTQVRGQPLFNDTTGGYDDIYLNTLSVGIILLMICGAIAGALWKSDKQKGELTL